MQKVELKGNNTLEVFIDEVDIFLIPDTELDILAQELEEDIYNLVKTKTNKHRYYENAKRKAKKPP